MNNLHNKVNVGIIGAGGIANNVHLPSLIEINQVQIMAVCDRKIERAQKIANQYSIPSVYTLYHEMLAKEELDAVFVLVEPDQSFRIVLDCLEYNIDVFTEKPAGITSFQTRTLLQKSQEKDLILQVGLNRRYIPLVQEVVKIMRETTTINQVEGSFIKHGSASFYSGSGSAYVCDTIHAIDLVRWIANGIPVAASTVQASNNEDITNAWSSVVKFNNGVLGIIKANYQTGARVHKFEIHGPEASAFINLGFGSEACEAEILFYGGKGTYSISATGPGKQKRLRLDGMEIAQSKNNYKFYGFYQEDLQFIESVKSRNKPQVDIKETLDTMCFIDLLRANIIE